MGTRILLAFLLACSVGGAVAAQEAPAVEDDVNHWVMLGYKFTQMGKPREAINAFERAMILEPEHKQARFGLGTAYIQLEEYRSALNVLIPLSDQYPDDYSLKNNIAWLYATAKDHSVRDGAKAVAAAQDALFVAPRDYHVWSTLSEAYYVLGDYGKALRAAEETSKLAGEQQAVQADMAEYDEQIQKCRKAAEAMSLIE